MTTLHSEIAIDAPVEKIWKILTAVGELQKYDPTVRTSTVTSERPDGLGASRRVDMEDGKHWFEEAVTVCNQNEALTYSAHELQFPYRSSPTQLSVRADWQSNERFAGNGI